MTTTGMFANFSGGTANGFIQQNNGVVNQRFIIEVSSLFGRLIGAGQLSTDEESRQKRVLLSKVKQYWIKGILERSLHSQAVIGLDLEERPDAIEYPSGELPEETGELNAGTSVTEIFNQIGERDGRTLLILGDPGAGKTITLLKLAENLVARAEGVSSPLIPVVFNLSSWTGKRQTIEDWLVQELWIKYQVPKKVSRSWIKNQKLLPLLDGLDEVKADRREACVEAINQFMQRHGLTEMVVCSRIADYEALSNRLKLRGAIYIRPLTLGQVYQYLDAAGEPLGAVKDLLQKDRKLQELAKSPLTLRIMTLVYYGKRAEELPQTGTIEERREHLFNAYIEQRFTYTEQKSKKKITHQQYPKDQTMHWLIWLAQRMAQTNQSVFLIEQMQPTWLPAKAQNRLYRFGSMLVGAVLIILILWPIYAWDPLAGYGVWSYLSEEDKGGIFNALRWGLVLGLIFGWGKAEIKTVETLTWPWNKTLQDLLSGILLGLKFGLIFSLVLAPIYGIWIGLTRWEGYGGWLSGLEWGIDYGLKWGMSLGLTLGLINSLKGSEIERKSSPNQGIRKSMTNAGVTGLISWLILVPIYWLNSNLISTVYWESIRQIEVVGSDLVDLMTPGLRWGLMLGLIFGGGLACIRHFTLRLILHRNNYIPWNYARFLDYATKLGFMQKVGGSYIFLHRMLLEHFAQIK